MEKMWLILINYANEHNSFGNKITASNFDTAVNIARQLGVEVAYTLGLKGTIKSLSINMDGIILKKKF